MQVIKNQEGYETEEINLFGECEKILEYLTEERIFSVNYDDREKAFWIGEECDQYFGAKLTSAMCKDLAELFNKIAERIETQ